MSTYVNLHNHSHFSFLDGLSSIDSMVNRAVELNQSALALSDHGSMGGAIQFYKKCKEKNIKPIIGVELYATPDLNLKGKSSEVNSHLICFAKNNQGYKNLIQLTSLASIGEHEFQFYHKPRVTLEMLDKYREGLIVSSACLSSPFSKGWLSFVASGVDDSEIQNARKKWAEFSENIIGVFSKDSFFFETQTYDSPEQREYNEIVRKEAKARHLPLICTSDCHYSNRSDFDTHNILLAIKTRQKLDQLDENSSMRHDSPTLYLHSEKEMQQLGFPQEEIENTSYLASMCDVNIDMSKKFPKVENAYEIMEEKCKSELSKRQLADNQVYVNRMNYELSVIKETGFSDYFMVLSDIINFAKDNGIMVGPGRGCLAPDSQIRLKDGQCKPIKDIHIGDRVVTLLGKDNIVEDIFAYDIKEKITYIQCGSKDNVLKLTNEHKILAIPRTTSHRTINKPIWTQAKDIKTGWHLVCPKPIHNEKEIQLDIGDYVGESHCIRKNDNTIFSTAKNGYSFNRKINFDSNLAKIIGFYIAEGNYSNGCLSFTFSNKEDHLIKEVKQSLLNIEPSLKINIRDVVPGGRQCFVYSTILGKFLVSLCGAGSKNKYIPTSIMMHGKKKFLAEMISSLYCGDGHDGSATKSRSVQYCTTSIILKNQLEFLLMKFGFWPSTIFNNSSRDNTLYMINVSGKQLNKWNTTFKNFPIVYKINNRNMNTRFMSDNNYFYPLVSKIDEFSYSGKVFDLKIQNEHNFIAQNIIVHNSGSGSLACMLLNITDIDPIYHELIFERFLNSERASLPDLDVDFEDERRHEVIEYIIKKYGRDYTANIGTISKLGVRQAFKDLAFVKGMDFQSSNKITNLIPVKCEKFSEAVKSEPSIKKIFNEVCTESLDDWVKIIDTLVGTPRQQSTHAAAMVISPEPILDHVPLMKAKENIVTMFDMHSIEDIGLVKFDILGLKNLTVIRKTLELLKTKNINLDELRKEMDKLDDTKAFSMIAEGKTLGLFQLETTGITGLCKGLNVSCFKDIVHAITLYRPAVLNTSILGDYLKNRKNPNKIKYTHPLLKEALEDTYGVCIFQEQLMKMSQVLAGFTMSEADEMRKGIAKKKPEILKKIKNKFLEGCANNNHSSEDSKKLWKFVEAAGDYSFNKAHAVSYGKISYDTAYLKYHYPLEFMISLLNCEEDEEKVMKYVQEIESLKIKILQPHVNKSKYNHHIENQDSIRLGLKIIKGVGKRVSEFLDEDIISKGEYKSIENFIERYNGSLINSKALTNMIKANCFDGLGYTRADLLEIDDKEASLLFNCIGDFRKAKEKNYKLKLKGLQLIDLKQVIEDGMKKINRKPEYLSSEIMALEKEAYGFYFSSDLDKYKSILLTNTANFQTDIINTDTSHWISGTIQSFKEAMMKNGKGKYGKFTFSDIHSNQVSCSIFGNFYERSKSILKPGLPILIYGKYNEYRGNQGMIISNARLIDQDCIDELTRDKNEST